jgi:aspartate racemase
MAHNLSYVIYTSGSTGRPKGVMIEHRTFYRFVVAAAASRGITESDRVLQFSSLSFDNSLGQIFPPLIRGGTLVLRSDQMVESMRHFARECRDKAISVLSLPTAFWHELVAAFEEEKLTLPSSVRLVIIAGEKALAHRVAQWHAHVARAARPARLINVYGPTEATVTVTQGELDSRAGRGDAAHSGVPIGRPLGSARVYILDRHLNPVPIGVPGELHVGGPVLARGYLNRPELTAEKFIPDPFSEEPGARLYKSGDLVRYLADGNIEFLGRVDDQVKLRGYRVELGEIESVLLSHARVRESVVVLREDAPEQQLLTAYVVPDGAAPSSRELRAFLRKLLPDYMVPTAFVVLNRLPLTPNGKVDRRALPAPEEHSRPEEDAFVAPRDELEEWLAQIWEEMLGVERVGIHDNFFELGGHSLLAINLFAQIERTFGRRLPPSMLFQAPTIEQLADGLRSSGRVASWRSLVEIQPHGSRPPIFCVHGGGGHVFIFRALARQLGVDQPFYALQAYQKKKQIVPLTVEDIAASYIRELREVQPEGPYYLGGFCFGGVVAFEMARQLHMQGQHVALLALLDTIRPGYRPEESDRAQQHFHARRLRSLGLLGYLRREVWRRRIKRRARDRVVFILAHWSWVPLPFALKASYILKQRARRATGSYEAQPYAGRITLFRSAGRFSQIYPDDPYWGWDSVAAGGVEVHEVPGRHGKMLSERHVRALAARLKTSLEQAWWSSS